MGQRDRHRADRLAILDALRRAALIATLGLGLSVGLAACSDAPVSAGQLRAYVASVEPIRLGVNQLLAGADPILSAYHDHTISPTQATSEMDRLERRFADYTVQIHALKPAGSVLAGLNETYAHTYVLEDSYLATLVSDMPGGDFSSLPNTQSDQRAAVIQWRTQLHVLALQTGVRLPADLDVAGRGEIAPSPQGR